MSRDDHIRLAKNGTEWQAAGSTDGKVVIGTGDDRASALHDLADELEGR